MSARVAFLLQNTQRDIDDLTKQFQRFRTRERDIRDEVVKLRVTIEDLETELEARERERNKLRRNAAAPPPPGGAAAAGAATDNPDPGEGASELCRQHREGWGRIRTRMRLWTWISKSNVNKMIMK